MKALILAAGLGSRLKEKTQDIPKCLVHLAEKPILAHQLDALKNNGINEIIIVIGYKGEKVKEFIASSKTYSNLAITFVENQQYNESNSSFSWWLASEKIKGSSYIHLNCDIVFDPKIINKLINNPNENVLLIDKKIKLNDSMEQVVLNGDKIILMAKANLPDANGRGSGIAKLSPDAIYLMLSEVQRYLANGDKNQHCYSLIKTALLTVPFYALDSESSFFREINTLEELAEAEKEINNYNQDRANPK